MCELFIGLEKGYVLKEDAMKGMPYYGHQKQPVMFIFVWNEIVVGRRKKVVVHVLVIVCANKDDWVLSIDFPY